MPTGQNWATLGVALPGGGSGAVAIVGAAALGAASLARGSGHRLRRPAAALALTAAMVTASLAPATAATAATAAGSDAPRLGTLVPGGSAALDTPLQVGVVLIGFTTGVGAADVDLGRVLQQLPATSDSVVREPLLYGIVKPTGVRFRFTYRTVVAPQAVEDAYFAFLAGNSQPAPLTPYQQLYNQQHAATRRIDANEQVDANTAERYLAGLASVLGLDSRQPVVFLIDGHRRPDFRYHVYVSSASPDPDTGANPGALAGAYALTAWGGSTDLRWPGGGTRRIWFDDLAAGPDFRTAGWNLDDADVSGDGSPDYRIPPAWEYGNTAGYRPFTSLSDDVAKLIRYVAVDDLFAASPIYDPALPGNALPDRITVDVNTFVGAEPALLQPDWIAQRLAELRPDAAHVDVTVRPQSWAVGGPVYQCWLTSWLDYAGLGRSCYPGRSPYGTAFEDQYFFEQDHHAQLVSAGPGFHIPVLYWSVPDNLAPVAPWGTLSGYTDDDWATGTQTYIYTVQWPARADLAGYGVGGSLAVEHEVGHFLGVPHPHDGVDTEQRIGFTPQDDFWFVWAGDESATPMSYLHLDHDFSQFDRDTVARNLTAAYLTAADSLVGSAPAAVAARADIDAAHAVAAYQNLDYQAALSASQRAYTELAETGARPQPHAASTGGPAAVYHLPRPSDVPGHKLEDAK